MGYTIKVTDRNSSEFGVSPLFEVLEALPSNDTGATTPQYEDDIGGAETLGDTSMSLAMVIVASICGEPFYPDICGRTSPGGGVCSPSSPFLYQKVFVV